MLLSVLVASTKTRTGIEHEQKRRAEASPQRHGTVRLDEVENGAEDVVFTVDFLCQRRQQLGTVY